MHDKCLQEMPCLDELPGKKGKYTLEAPPAAHLDAVTAALANSEPPAYASQLKRRGGKLDVTAVEAEADMNDHDAMIAEMEDAVGEEAARDTAIEEKAAAQKAAKAKTKGKAKVKGKAKSKPSKSEHADKPEAMEEAPEEDLAENVPYPTDPYEPPSHITANHIYSNVYRRTMTSGGLNKEAAAEAARFQALIFRIHGVVSRSMVGTFRVPKAKPTE